MSYDIYLHENIINGKKYIGVTKLGFITRWKHHVRKAKYYSKINQAVYFHRAIVKYGEKNWTHVLLEKTETLESAEILETKWIAFYKSNDREFGYNLTPGGNISRHTMSDEMKKQISDKIKIIMSSPTRRLKQSKIMIEWLKINDNPFLGKKHSAISKRKMSIALKGRFAGSKNPYYGCKHSDAIRSKMSEAAKKRCANPNWKAPLQLKPLSEEIRRRISEAKKGVPTGRWSKDVLLEAASKCKTKRQIAEILGCTPSNVSFLMKYYNCKIELERLLDEFAKQ